MEANIEAIIKRLNELERRDHSKTESNFHADCDFNVTPTGEFVLWEDIAELIQELKNLL